MNKNSNLIVESICLSKFLGKKVKTPEGIMKLVEIYSNGNCACIPIKCFNYLKELKEFHSCSVEGIK